MINYQNPMGMGNMNFGYGYARNPLPNPTNPLSKDEQNLLKQKAPSFSLAVSKMDALKAICTHRNENGDTLRQNPDGTVTCEICGTTFRPVGTDVERVKEAFRVVLDCLETTKIMYMDIPDEVAKGFFQMIPFLEKGPQLFQIALDHYSRYNNSTVMSKNFNNGNAFALYSMMMNPGMAMGMGAPMMNQQPMGQPGMAMNAPMMNNGMPVPDATMTATNTVNPFDSNENPAAQNAQQTVTDNKQYQL